MYRGGGNVAHQAEQPQVAGVPAPQSSMPWRPAISRSWSSEASRSAARAGCRIPRASASSTAPTFPLSLPWGSGAIVSGTSPRLDTVAITLVVVVPIVLALLSLREIVGAVFGFIIRALAF
jgi:hypothetical protein